MCIALINPYDPEISQGVHYDPQVNQRQENPRLQQNK